MDFCFQYHHFEQFPQHQILLRVVKIRINIRAGEDQNNSLQLTVTYMLTINAYLSQYKYMHAQMLGATISLLNTKCL